MAAGFDFLLKRGDGGGPEVFTVVGALRAKTLTADGGQIDVTTDDDKDANGVLWSVFETGVHSFELTASGVAKLTAKTDLQAMYDDFATGAVANYQVVVPFLGTWEVALVVTNMTIPAQHDQEITFDTTLVANGAPVFTPEA
jgi:predicted secreted protein